MAKAKVIYSHNVFLDEADLSKLLNKFKSDSYGNFFKVNIEIEPKKINTNEPAEEVFCKYKLQKTKIKKGIKIKNNSFVINIPEKEFEELNLLIQKDIPYLMFFEISKEELHTVEIKSKELLNKSI
jgi:hypothetical protein